MVNDDSYNPNDAETVRQIVAGDVNAFEHLVKRYEKLVVAIVAKHVPYENIEDIAQDVFLRTYRSLPTFKSNDGFKPWLSVIAARTCYDFWRECGTHREVPMSSLSEEHQVWLEAALAEESSRSFHEKGLQKEAREILDWALGRLSAKDRTVLELVYLEGNSIKETAHLLGLSTANVKVRLFRSRRKLKELFTTVAKERRSNP